MSLYDGLRCVWNHRDEEEYNQSFGGKRVLSGEAFTFISFICVCVLALVMEWVLYNRHWKIREFYYIDVIN